MRGYVLLERRRDGNRWLRIPEARLQVSFEQPIGGGAPSLIVWGDESYYMAIERDVEPTPIAEYLSRECDVVRELEVPPEILASLVSLQGQKRKLVEMLMSGESVSFEAMTTLGGPGADSHKIAEAVRHIMNDKRGLI